MNEPNYSNSIALIEHFCDLSRYLSNNYPLIIKDLSLYNNEIFLEETFSITKPNGKTCFPYCIGLLTDNEHGSCHVHIFLKDSKKPFAKINLEKKPTSLQEIKSNTEFKNKSYTFSNYTGIEPFLTYIVNTWLDSKYESNRYNHDEHSKYAMAHNLTYFEYFQYKWPFILDSNPSASTNTDNKKKNKKKR